MTTMDDDQQSVADDVEPSKADTGASDAQDDDLEALLEGLEGESKPAQADAKPDTSNLEAELQVLRAEVKETKEAAIADRTGRAENDVIARIKGSDEMLSGVSDKLIKAYLQSKWMGDPRLAVAFGQQHNDPAKWARIEKALTQEILDEFSAIPSPKSTEDREAAEAAARGVSNTAPTQDTSLKPQADLTNMTDAEYKAYKTTIPAGAS